jgi:hypothetical protein
LDVQFVEVNEFLLYLLTYCIVYEWIAEVILFIFLRINTKIERDSANDVENNILQSERRLKIKGISGIRGDDGTNEWVATQTP